jgi:hypothetical protein
MTDLPDDSLTALVAMRDRGFSYAQIGDSLGISPDAARGRYRRASVQLARRDRPVAAAADGLSAGSTSDTTAGGPDRPSDPELRAANNRLLRELAKSKATKDELVQAVYDAAHAAASSINLPATPPPVLDLRRGGEEVAVAVLSDWQLGKRTPSYDSVVCAERIEKYAEKVIRLTDIQRKDHPVKHLRVHILGDIVEGEMIFPGQAHLVDSSLYEQVVENGPSILAAFLRKMLANFETVTVVAVIGNHGRIGRKGDFNPQTNADRMLYRITQRILEGEARLSWDIPSIPNERAWYAISVIGNYSALLIHGDQFRGTAGIPWYGIAKKAGGWAMGAIPESFDDVDFGHFHQPTTVTLNNVTARCSGSPESHNDFAAEQLAAVGRPSQSLRFVHPERGIVTAEYCVWLTEAA